MRYTIFLWVVTILGTLAAFYGGATVVTSDPTRPLITVRAVVDKLKVLSEKGAPPLAAGYKSDSKGEDERGVVLYGHGVVLCYLRRGEKGTKAEEQVDVTLESTRGSLTLLFHGATLKKVNLDGIEFEDDMIPRALRADLGTILRLTRLLVRDNPIKEVPAS